MRCVINGKEYDFRTDIRDREAYRRSFIALAKTTFGLDFEPWYRNGYWGDSFIPYSLLDGDRVMANVSVSLIDTQWQGRRMRFVQLGTVMTDRNCRGRGLARWLMNAVRECWESRCECIYLYANDEVLGFYPRFGFTKAHEYQCRLPIRKKEAPVRRLDMDSERDRALLLRCYALSNPFSALPMEDNPGLLMFYCGGPLRSCIYYMEGLEAVVIAEHDGEDMLCYDVFCPGGPCLEELLSAAAEEETRRAVLGFSPLNAGRWETFLRKDEGSTMFVSNRFGFLMENRLMFPLLSHT